jgi:hypothetical protein
MPVRLHAPDRRRGAGLVASAWALLGIVVLLLFAVVRLGRNGLTTLQEGLRAEEWVALVGLTTLFVYAEGRRALQQRWVPQVIRRAAALRKQRALVYRILAPLYGMSLIGARPGIVMRAWAISGAIVVAALVVRAFPEPWRGITDLAVAAALAWGLAAIAVRAPEVFR